MFLFTILRQYNDQMIRVNFYVPSSRIRTAINSKQSNKLRPLKYTKNKILFYLIAE